MAIIREAGEADLPAILAIYNEAVANTTATADEQPVTLDHRLAWFRERRRLGLPVLVAESEGGIVAWGALNPYNPRSGYRFSVENSVYVDASHRGRGIGRQMLSELIDRARALGSHTVIASIDSENAASLRLHESFGFIEAGRYRELILKFGRWLDVVHLQLMLE